MRKQTFGGSKVYGNLPIVDDYRLKRSSKGGSVDRKALLRWPSTFILTRKRVEEAQILDRRI